MADKYVGLDTGQMKEVEGTVISSGPANSGDIAALGPDGLWDQSLMPIGITPDTKQLIASETLAAGDLINVWDNGGVTKARKADASTVGKEANGFVLEAVIATEMARVYFDGTNNQVTGLVGGNIMFLSSSVPGTSTSTPPSTVGNLVQPVGKSISTTELSFEPGQGIVLA